MYWACKEHSHEVDTGGDDDPDENLTIAVNVGVPVGGPLAAPCPDTGEGALDGGGSRRRW